MDKNNKTSLLRYAGLTMQFLVAIGIALFGGMKLDEWLKLSFPLLVWLLPLLVITGVIIQIVKDTGAKK
ncbi:MAG: ATPase F0F1 [Chitinophagaceae bacterium]|nr:MAG: ATPase F0F1 [Chitinophagaceae bacterium]